MFWEEMTGDEFEGVVKQVESVCLLPLSVIERHSHHLPLGTDMYIGREMCRRAAALEPAVIFPNMIFTQILEAQHCSGTIAVDADVMIQLANNLVREISRNGFKKIIMVNAHGGNRYLMGYLTQIQLRAPSDTVLYGWNPQLLPEDKADIEEQWDTTVDGHAGENETSQMMAIRPDLVRYGVLPANDEGMPLGRLDDLRAAGLVTGISWYADHPTHYRGDGLLGTALKGDRYLDAVARSLAHCIQLVKQDTVAPKLLAEFFAAANGHTR